MKVKFDKITGCLRESDEGEAPSTQGITRVDLTAGEYGQLDPPRPDVLYVVDTGENLTKVYLGTLLIASVEVPDPEPVLRYKSVVGMKDDWTGDYLIASVADGMVGAGNLANYLIPCHNVEIESLVGYHTISPPAADMVGAKTFTFGDRYFVQSGTYGGRYAYSISYLNSNNERKYLTYSSSGLSNGSTVSSNSRWIPASIGSDGVLQLVNIGTTTCRLYFYNGNIQQLVSSNHGNRPAGYNELTLFELVSL